MPWAVLAALAPIAMVWSTAAEAAANFAPHTIQVMSKAAFPVIPHLS